MDKKVSIIMSFENQKQVEATREISKIYIQSDGNVYWQIDTIYDKKIIKKEYYNKPLKDIKDLDPQNFIDLNDKDFNTKSIAGLIEKILWTLTFEIDSMPTQTPEEIRKKSLRYGKTFRVEVN